MPTVNTTWFVAGSSGLSDFSDGTALTGYRNLAGAGPTNGAVYSYRAEHPTDKSIWENGSGAVNTGTNVLARTTIAESSTGAKINFAVPPVVFLPGNMKSDWDLVAPRASPSFTGTVTSAGVVDVTDATEASGSSTGSIVTAGGINAAKAIKTNSTTAATSTTTGSGIFAGGIGVAGKGYFGGAVKVNDTTVATSATTGSGIFGGGVGIAGSAFIGDGLWAASDAGIGVTAVNSTGANAKFGVSFSGAAREGIVANDTAASNGASMVAFRSNGTAIGNVSNNNNTGVLYNTASDRERKCDERPFARAGEIIQRLEIWDFAWKGTEHRGVGVFAQDAHKIFPAAITPSKERGGWQADYSKFVPVLIAHAQELQRRVDTLETRRAR